MNGILASRAAMPTDPIAVPAYGAGKNADPKLFAPPWLCVGQIVRNPGIDEFSLPSPYVIHEPMLGRMNVSDPVCISSSAPPCREFDPHIDLMKQMSSTFFANRGNRSLTHAPLCPYCLNAHGDCSRLNVSLDTTFGRANGSGFPWSRFNSGL